MENKAKKINISEGQCLSCPSSLIPLPNLIVELIIIKNYNDDMLCCYSRAQIKLFAHKLIVKVVQIN